MRSKVDKLRSQARQMCISESHSPVKHGRLLTAEGLGLDDDDDDNPEEGRSVVGKKRRWEDSENRPAKKVPCVTINDENSLA